MTVYTVERIQQVYELWTQNGLKDLRVVHIDYHCDMRGMMVDRERQCAWRIRDVRERLDCGNYLRHAVFEGVVSGI